MEYYHLNHSRKIVYVYIYIIHIIQDIKNLKRCKHLLRYETNTHMCNSDNLCLIYEWNSDTTMSILELPHNQLSPRHGLTRHHPQLFNNFVRVLDVLAHGPKRPFSQVVNREMFLPAWSEPNMYATSANRLHGVKRLNLFSSIF